MLPIQNMRLNMKSVEIMCTIRRCRVLQKHWRKIHIIRWSMTHASSISISGHNMARQNMSEHPMVVSRAAVQGSTLDDLWDMNSILFEYGMSIINIVPWVVPWWLADLRRRPLSLSPQEDGLENFRRTYEEAHPQKHNEYKETYMALKGKTWNKRKSRNYLQGTSYHHICNQTLKWLDLESVPRQTLCQPYEQWSTAWKAPLAWSPGNAGNKHGQVVIL